MGRPHSYEIRWLAVYKRLFLDMSWKQVRKDLCGVSKHFQEDWIRVFVQTGDVGSKKRRERKMSAEHDLRLIGMVLDDPTATLSDHSTQLRLEHGLVVSISTLCRALRRLGLSHQRLQHYAYKRDEVAALSFWTQVMRVGWACRVALVT